MLITALVVASFVLTWLLLTWWNADDEPALAPYKPGRVTFKQVVQNAFADMAELVAPARLTAARFWAWAAPKLTNPTTWAALLVNFGLAWPTLAADPIGQALLTRYPWLYTVGALVALFATRQAHAPRSLPPGPLVNGAAL